MIFPKDGVLASYLFGEFLDELGGVSSLKGLTTGQVIEYRIKPKTMEWKSSYCTWLKQQNHAAYRTTANAFISHGHAYMFLDLINALQWLLRDEESMDTILWIDFFAINQHEPIKWTFEWLSTTFKSAIQEMGRIIMVMSPWDDPLPLKRSWCVYEAYCAAESNGKFDIALSQTDEEQFLRDIQQQDDEEDGKGFKLKVNKLLNTIRSEQSECNEKDKAAIFEVIRTSVGFSRLDWMVCKRYRTWFIEVIVRALENCQEEGNNSSGNRFELLRAVAMLYHSHGDNDKAEYYYREALEYAKFHYGKDGSKTLVSMSDLTKTLYRQGKYSEAEEVNRECLEQQAIVLGRDHPDTLSSMNSFATTLCAQSKHAEAEDFFRLCLERRKIVLGPNHPNTVRTMNSLISVLHQQGKDPTDGDSVHSKNNDQCSIH